MSWTQHSGIATCTVSNVLSGEDLIAHLYDYLTNHEDEIPENLGDCGSLAEFETQIEPYINLDGNNLTLTVDTEESNCDGEIFDFLVNHYAHLMSGKFIKVIWVSYDSRDGLSGDCFYYDKNGDLIDIETWLNSR